MSRIGKQPIPVPSGVSVAISGRDVNVKGPKGNLNYTTHAEIDVKQEGDSVIVSPKEDRKDLRKFHGLTRSLVNNMVLGVSTGFSKRLKLIGVGSGMCAQF